MMRRFLLAAAAALLVAPAYSQDTPNPSFGTLNNAAKGLPRVFLDSGRFIGYIDANGNRQQVDPTHPLPVTGATGGSGGVANPYPGSDYAKDHTDYFKTGGAISNTAFGVNNFPASYPDAAADAAIGTKSDGAYNGTGDASLVQALKGIYAIINSQGQAPIAPGTNIIGKVGIDQSTPGTTNKISLGSDNVNVTVTAQPASGALGPSAPGTAATSSLQTGGVYRANPATLIDGQQTSFGVNNLGRMYSDISPYLNPNAPAGGAPTTSSSPVALPKDQGLLVGTGETTPSTLTAGQLATLSYTLSHLARVDASGATVPVSAPGGGAVATAAGQSAQQGPANTPGAPSTYSVLGGCVFNSTALALTTGQQAGLQCDAAGRPYADIAPYLNTNDQKPMSGSSPVVIASNQTAIPVNAAATATVGGVASFSRIPSVAASTNLTTAKASAGRIYKLFACNTTTTAYRIKFYNAASTGAVTVGTTPILFTRALPPAAAAGGLACASFDITTLGWYFSTGITYAITAGAADADTVAPAAGAITDLSVEYN